MYRIALLLLCIHSSVICLPDETALRTVFLGHMAQLKHTQIQQDAFVITFSGTPGMGKTEVAKKLEESLKAIRISTDNLRALLHETANVSLQEYDEALQLYIQYFFQHYCAPNRRIILDASIDRKYARVFAFLSAYTIPYTVIRLEVSEEIVRDRLKQREGERASWYLKNLASWIRDYQEFGNTNQNYIAFNNVDNSEHTYNQLLDRLEADMSKNRKK